ncbi:GGDEF domain-containing protein [Hartmannibacter diazotrophicus]|uniref:GGDEF domain-containing protein n=1 Tax=Hartmannibacter diazotrophicus TaxID=1482074 RepID=UPI001AECF486|nr:GGDEF domain-containing protein [Hartmannibacter diazotrophicus]
MIFLLPIYPTMDLWTGVLIGGAVPALLATPMIFALLRLLQKLRHLNVRMRQIAMTDDLTGLLNRRAFMDRAGDKNGRIAEGVGLLLIDVDRFKLINDTFGHASGDMVLVRTAETIREWAGEGSLVARLGGEEFVVLCSSVEAGDTLAIAERIRQEVESGRMLFADHIDVETINIGVACARQGETVNSLLIRADNALYAAKAAGRNRVVPCKEAPPVLNPAEASMPRPPAGQSEPSGCESQLAG